MKNEKKTSKRFFLFLSLFICLGIANLANRELFNTDIIKNEDHEVNENPSTAGYWDLTGSPIFIDDSDSNYNWSITEAENDWCSGSGTWNDPYVIENVRINGQNSTNCINIENSNVAFIIRNCTLYNASSYPNTAAIHLRFVNNSNIYGNNCSFNNYHGIYSIFGNNNTFSKNIADYNRIFGIYLAGSNNNSIIGNNASKTLEGYGIGVATTHNSFISGNEAKHNNGHGGFQVEHSQNNTFIGNIAEGNIGMGMRLSKCKNTHVENNIIKNNTKEGIRMFNYDITDEFNVITSNIINNNSYTGISIWQSNFNTISDNNISYNLAEGIKLQICEKNYIENNNVSHNDVTGSTGGIGVYQSHNNTINENDIMNNGLNGILCKYNTLNKISKNNINNNSYDGINVYQCNSTSITENEVNHNGRNGIQLEHECYNNEISSNVVDDNQNGISVNADFDPSVNNTISSNLIESNDYYGVLLDNSNNNSIDKNILRENKNHGIYLDESFYNTILENLIVNNDNDGVNLYQSDYNNIKENRIENNTYAGIFLDSGDASSDYNLIFKNYLIGNNIHAVDEPSTNFWNNTYIGNYWDNYTGSDADNDGIGDTIHSFEGGIDYLPIFGDPFFDGNPIIIDDSGATGYTWQQASTRAWCNGYGTLNHPYVIEELIINGQNSTSCIEIRNSNAHFIIKECLFINASSNLYDAGIKLTDVNYGQILRNNCSLNNYAGITLDNSNNNTITGNKAFNNAIYGIFILDSENNSVIENTAKYNEEGIALYICKFNKINNNIGNNNTSCGINIGGANYENKIKNNVIESNNIGIAQQSSNENKIFNNNATYNDYGMFLRGGSNNTILGNIFRKNGKGIHMDSFSNNNNITNNIIIDNVFDGIEIRDSIGNAITTNLILSQGDAGIRLNRANKTEIMHSRFDGNFYGIYFDISSHNTTVLNNNFTNNGMGISIQSSNTFNTIYNNSLISNTFMAAEDKGANNNWNSTLIGNYWDDYSGSDLNDDGIGDDPYNITGLAGSRDYLPIWDDGPEIIPPGSFTLNSTADSPDTDGDFDLSWSISAGADNYSVYTHSSYINEINGSLTLLADQNGISPHAIPGLTDGTYYYIIVAFNEAGQTLSNCVVVNVQIPLPGAPEDFDMVTIITIISAVGGVSAISIIAIIKIKKRKGTKMS